MWEIKHTDTVGSWGETLSEAVQEAIAHDAGALEAIGPGLGRPLVDIAKGSRFGAMKELRTQRDGEPYRTFFDLDPRRHAILLIGGSKQGDTRFYEKFVPQADALCQAHLAQLRREGLL